MNAADFSQLLVVLASNDNQARAQAEQMLENLKVNDLPKFMILLVSELADETKPNHLRQLAGLQLKNVLESRDPQKKALLEHQWMRQDEETKTQIRNKVLLTLHSSAIEARKTAAQVLAEFASVDLVNNQWLNVIDAILKNISEPQSVFGIQSSLMAIGFLCDMCRAPALKHNTNQILTAVIQGMRETTNNDIKLAATEALVNCLVFVQENFERDSERNYIMETVCQSTQSPDARIRRVAFECLVKIGYLYYDKLKPYMEAIFTITTKALTDPNEHEDVQLQAIEFWTSLAETEAIILEEMEIAQENNITPDRECYNIISQALSPLVNLMTQCLVRQSEYQEDGDMCVSNYASNCIAAMALVTGESIVNEIMPFVSNNINNQDWHFKEAATLAFSAILDGPRQGDRMNDLINRAMPFLLAHVSDPVLLVKDTSVFALGRIAEFHPDPLIDHHLENVLKALSVAVNDEARICSKACWTILHIAEALSPEGGDEKQTYPLSPYFKTLAEMLLASTLREDSSEYNLRINAYEALSALVHSAARDTFEILDMIVAELLNRLEHTLTLPQTEEVCLIQGLMCGSLQVAARKLEFRIVKHADRIMTFLLKIFDSKSVNVHEEAFLAVGAVASALSQDFDRYMPHFLPFLLRGLQTYQYEQICVVSVNIIGDLCIALREKLFNYTDAIMEQLLKNLQTNELHRNVKPNIIASFGDIALAIGARFEKYLAFVGNVLIQACEAQVDTSSEEMVSYLNLLRENVLEAYIGILLGFKKENPQAFIPYVDPLLSFVKVVFEDPNTDQEVFKNAVSIVGDLANVYEMKIKHSLQHEFIKNMIEDACNSQDQETKQRGNKAKKSLKKISLF
nr:unnamed protein product [Naegleria fowleri]